MQNSLAPIVLFVFNRPDCTLKSLSALMNNRMADKSTLYIFADGPKEGSSEKQLDQIRKVRSVIRKKKWCKEVYIIESETNNGLVKSIMNGVSSVVNQYSKIIVLEDDLVVTKGFLDYLNKALNLYENEEQVISISAYMYPVKIKPPETFFLRMAECWGWATWKRGWDLLETNPEKLLNNLTSQNLDYEFDFNGNFPFTEMLNGQTSGKKYSWAILWYATAFLKNKLTLYPNRSLVKHIGKNGTNYKSDPFFDKVIMADSICVKPVPIIESVSGRKAVSDFFGERKRYFHNKEHGFKKKLELFYSYKIKPFFYFSRSTGK